MSERRERRERTGWALALIVATLAAGNLGRRLLPDAAQLPVNLALAATVVGIAVFLGATTTAELGLERRRAGSGLRTGAVAGAVVIAVVVAAAAVPATRGFFDDERADVGVAGWVGAVAVEIPFGTIVLEELAFRGCLLALTMRVLSVRLAVVVSSVLFGLWHIGPAITSAEDNATLEDVGREASGLLGLVGGTVLATTVAGIVFCWLRLRSGSLLAPALAHWAVNASAFTAAWILAP